MDRRSSNEELAHRVTAIEDRLGMDVDPPLDRLSTIEYKVDGLRDLLNYQSITLGDHGRALTRLEAVQLQHGRVLVDLKSDVSGLKTDVSGLKTDVSVLKTDVSVLKTDVSVLKTDVSVLKTDVSVLKTDVSVLKTDVSVLKTDVSVLKTDLAQTNAGVQKILELLTAGPKG